MPTFLSGSEIFAIAGAIAAAGPVIIHLIHRRRFRVVHWAAMDFLMEATQQSRRILRLRDLLLLILRSAAVLLFGLALARPYFSASRQTMDPNQPLHAVLVVDNSLSMAYRDLHGTLLDQARDTAKDFIQQLPEGSQISVLPLCGSPAGIQFDSYRTKEDARNALDEIDIVDRSGSASRAFDLALAACEHAPLLAKRIVLLSDQQETNWRGASYNRALNNLPDMQIVQIAPKSTGVSNTWVADVRLQDSIADTDTSAVFLAVIRHEGAQRRENVQVVLTIEGEEVATATVDLEPGQSRIVSFTHRFDDLPDPRQTRFVPVRVSVTPDRLGGDDFRDLVVPVVTALPVVFVDQLGHREDPQNGLYGETHHLRRLIAPVTSRSTSEKAFVEIRHVAIGELNRLTLEDARLVVVAGVQSPAAANDLLYEYVLQGGQLVIAAGAGFDPIEWQRTAWQDGNGILPVPLDADPIGILPEDAANALAPFQLATDSLSHNYFRIADASDEELAELYSEPYFFKAVRCDVSDALLKGLIDDAAKRILASWDADAAAEASTVLSNREPSRGVDAAFSDDRRDPPPIYRVPPSWISWTHPLATASRPLAPEDRAEWEKQANKLARRDIPRVLAMFENGVPFMVERNVGYGRVLFVASGTYSSWNTLPKTNAILIFDRIMRSMLQNTLPRFNLDSNEKFVLPVRSVDRRKRHVLIRPDKSEEPLEVGALGADRYGLTVGDISVRGTYTITTRSTSNSDEDRSRRTASLPGETPMSDRSDPKADLRDPSRDSNLHHRVSFTSNGPEGESELAPLDADRLAERLGDASDRWIRPGASIRLDGAQVWGQDMWWWLVVAVLACLLTEMVILAKPAFDRRARS